MRGTQNISAIRMKFLLLKNWEDQEYVINKDNVRNVKKLPLNIRKK